jgi:hypothetical protein
MCISSIEAPSRDKQGYIMGIDTISIINFNKFHNKSTLKEVHQAQDNDKFTNKITESTSSQE